VAALAYFGLVRPRLAAAARAVPAEALRDVPAQRLRS